jgi:hypothetical protein
VDNITLNKDQEFQYVFEKSVACPIDDISTFTKVQSENKLAGLTEKLIYKNDKNETFLLKPFAPTSSNSNETPKFTNVVLTQKEDCVRELVTSAMYEYLLPDQAPHNVLMKNNDTNELYLSSKLIDGAKAITKSSEEQNINSDCDFSNIKGLEPMLAASYLLGESDGHAGNIITDGDKFIKIDHGKSCTQHFNNFPHMITGMYSMFSVAGYDESINSGKLQFNFDTYASESRQMLEKLSVDKVDKIIDAQIENLKNNGFDFTDMKLDRDLNKILTTSDEVKDYLKENMQMRIESMTKIVHQAEIVSKFDKRDNILNKMGIYMNENGNICPVYYAHKQGITIEGKPALEWAKEQKPEYTCEIYPDALGKIKDKLLTDNCPEICKNNIKIDGKDAIVYAYEKNIQIEGKPALEWAHANNYTCQFDENNNNKDLQTLIETEQNALKKEFHDRVLYAHENNIKIDGKDAIVYAHKENIAIDGKSAIEYALSNRYTPKGNDQQSKEFSAELSSYQTQQMKQNFQTQSTFEAKYLPRRSVLVRQPSQVDTINYTL